MSGRKRLPRGWWKANSLARGPVKKADTPREIHVVFPPPGKTMNAGELRKVADKFMRLRTRPYPQYDMARNIRINEDVGRLFSLIMREVRASAEEGKTSFSSTHHKSLLQNEADRKAAQELLCTKFSNLDFHHSTGLHQRPMVEFVDDTQEVEVYLSWE